MEQIRFCQGEFSIGPVLNLLKENEAYFNLIRNDWEVFGFSLGLNADEMQSLKEKIGTEHDIDILREVLRVWRRNHGDDATLKVLYDALIDVDAAELAALFRNTFGGIRDERVDVEAAGHGADNNVDGPHDNLLRAIYDGNSIQQIRKILSETGNPNVVNNENGRNAGHYVMKSLFMGKINLKRAMEILNLLVDKGFNQINTKDHNGHSALYFAMGVEGLEDELLRWFADQDADFNSTDDLGGSVLFSAIMYYQKVDILEKLIDFFGCSAKHRDQYNFSVLHQAAIYGHDSAIEFFIHAHNRDCNEKANGGATPLHLLPFSCDGDSQRCLQVLLEAGADFSARCSVGDVPLMRWMKMNENPEGNPFPILMKVKDQLPLTQEIVSDTLATIVKEIERLQKFLPPPSSLGRPIEFAEFVIFLIQKEAKLQFNLQDQWNHLRWNDEVGPILTRRFFDELRKFCHFPWPAGEGEEDTRIRATVLGKLDFHNGAEGVGVSVEIEMVLRCLLGSRSYLGFVTICKLLKGLIKAEN